MTTFRDGDIIVTKENLVFYAFGYVHPTDRVISYLKYLPKELKPLFPLDFLEVQWDIQGQKFVRPKDLYTPDNFQKIRNVFHDHFPNYLYSCPYIGDTLIAVPIKNVKKVYRPNESLINLLQKRQLGPLESLAAKLITLLSEITNVPMEDFGIHGSLTMGVSSQFSDIDVTIYGALNYSRVKDGVKRLVNQGRIRYLFEDKADEFRRNKGRFEGTKFVFNAVRKSEEIQERYGQYCYQALKRLSFICKISECWESNFKPAIYGIIGIEPLEDFELDISQEPIELISMIGRYRGIAEEKERVKVVGMLEKVTNTENGTSKYRVVVGSIGAQEEEYIWPVEC